jgi:hypothetical protein
VILALGSVMMKWSSPIAWQSLAALFVALVLSLTQWVPLPLASGQQAGPALDIEHRACPVSANSPDPLPDSQPLPTVESIADASNPIDTRGTLFFAAAVDNLRDGFPFAIEHPPRAWSGPILF